MRSNFRSDFFLSEFIFKGIFYIKLEGISFFDESMIFFWNSFLRGFLNKKQAQRSGEAASQAREARREQRSREMASLARTVPKPLANVHSSLSGVSTPSLLVVK